MAARSISPVLAQNFFNYPRAGKHSDTQICIGAIAPSVRNPFAKVRYITRLSRITLILPPFIVERIHRNRFNGIPAKAIVPVAIAAFSSGPPRRSA